jgi:cytochrome c-type biogenesis protein CcmH
MDRKGRPPVIGLLSLLGVVALSFGQPGPGGALETEARAIDAMLIAPCCFTQQVSVHQSAAAEDVRRDVRARLAAGQTRQQILDAYVARYGKRILVEPPARGFALTLYVVPFVLIIASAGLVAVVLRRFTRRQPASTGGVQDGTALTPMSPRDVERLDDELRDLD